MRWEAATMDLLQKYFKRYMEDILGLKGDVEKEDGKLEGVIGLLIEIRKEAKARKDYATSDKIRHAAYNSWASLLKDEEGWWSELFVCLTTAVLNAASCGKTL